MHTHAHTHTHTHAHTHTHILGIPAARLPRNTRSDMSFPIRFGGMEVGDLVALADAAHAVGGVLVVRYAMRFITAQDVRVRGNSHGEVHMEPTMYGRLVTALTTTVSRRHGTHDGDDGDNEPMWPLELALSWARLEAACSSHALAESEPLIT
jgi:hypothetical protein